MEQAYELIGDIRVLNKEKFAELIIKECIKITKKYQNVGGNCYPHYMIADHFGIKKE